MSYVTNVILVVGVLDDRNVHEFNEALAKHPDNYAAVELVDVGKHAGGRKNLECYLYAAAFNYAADLVQLLRDRVRVGDWDSPENVVLVIEPQDGATEVHRPKGY